MFLGSGEFHELMIHWLKKNFLFSLLDILLFCSMSLTLWESYMEKKMWQCKAMHQNIFGINYLAYK